MTGKNHSNDHVAPPATTETPVTETPVEVVQTAQTETQPTAEATTTEVPVTGPVPDETIAQATAETIKVTLIGALDALYEGPAGKTLKDMIPELAGTKKYQAREIIDGKAKMISQVVPWMHSATIKTVEHAVHG